jgi:hypothetical protein
VWESLPQAEQFVAELKRKAGLVPETRTSACTVKRYRVLKWTESQFRREA